MARLTPQQKKRLAYERDHVSQAEYPHLARKGRPKWKAIAARSERRRADRLVDGLHNRPADAVLEEAETQGLTAAYLRDARSPIRYWRHPVVTLGEHVDDRISRRVNVAGWHFFDQPYDSATHRAAFAGFLESATRSSGSYAREVAGTLADALDPSPPRVLSPYRIRMATAYGRWLRAFFRDEPEWEPRLREWLDQMLEEGE